MRTTLLNHPMSSRRVRIQRRNTPRSFWIVESHLSFEKLETSMPEGTIKRINDRGFGFIENGTQKDVFFHSSSVTEANFEDLKEGQRVMYDVGRGPKGPVADNVRLA